MDQRPQVSATEVASGAADERASANIRGIALMVVSGACYASMAAVIRGLADEIHPYEMIFFRALFGFLIVLPFFARGGWVSMRTTKLGIYAARSGVQVVAQMAFYVGIAMIPLAASLTLSMTHAIFASAGAVIFLGEPSLWRRWAAIAVGFTGALVIVRPDTMIAALITGGDTSVNFELGALLLVLATMGYAVLTVNGKYLTRTESVSSIIAWTLMISTPLTLILASFYWTWPTFPQLFQLFLIGAFGTGGNVTMTRAFKSGEMTALAPVMYVRLIWAAALGYLLFGEIPAGTTWIGAVLITATGIYLSRLERRRPKPNNGAVPPGK